MKAKRIAIFASGNGTNAQRIVEYFSDKKEVEICLILSNKPNAGVLLRAQKLGVRAEVFNRDEFKEGQKVDELLQENNIDLIVLAGFLWLIPGYLTERYPNRIINIHPALLPKFGGKGMYGMNVHQAVIESGEIQSGISIHYVNNKYDDGQIIFQAKTEIGKSETPESLADKIHQLEYEYFPIIIEREIKKI
ncbi:MAG: phosphoribosylglycinamide formyltransferase [Marinilabiliales bacterium]|nr:MAG: phosphoribosylglycinamide formyltransferase [Marinilabiliales bacterium]